jgi:hypothetical protein
MGQRTWQQEGVCFGYHLHIFNFPQGQFHETPSTTLEKFENKTTTFQEQARVYPYYAAMHREQKFKGGCECMCRMDR